MNRRAFLAGTAALLAAHEAAAQARIEPVPLDEGRLTQAWFLNSFLVLKDDLTDAAAIEALAARLDPESVQLWYQIALQGREDLPLAPDEHGGFVMTVLRMLAFRPEGAGKELPAPKRIGTLVSQNGDCMPANTVFAFPQGG